MLKRTAPGRGRKIAGAVSIVVVATASGYAAWASSPQVETLAVEAPRLLEHSLAASASPATSPAIKVKTVLAAPKRVSAVESRRVERDLSAVTQAELALVAARTRYERSVGTRRDVINAADRLGVLQSRFGLKETGYEAAVTEVRDDLADVRARFEHGLASRDDIINAATRLGGLQARLGEKATGYDDALTGAKADLEAVRRGRQFGVSTLADLSLAEERVTVLERLAGR